MARVISIFLALDCDMLTDLPVKTTSTGSAKRNSSLLEVTASSVIRCALVCVLSCVGLFCGTSTQAAEEPVDFHEQVLPVLKQNCFKCHGEDAKTRKADLRLDRREEATARVPDEMVIGTTLVGDDQEVGQRIAAYRRAGITTLRVQPEGATVTDRLDTLARIVDLIRRRDPKR